MFGIGLQIQRDIPHDMDRPESRRDLGSSFLALGQSDIQKGGPDLTMSGDWCGLFRFVVSRYGWSKAKVSSQAGFPIPRLFLECKACTEEREAFHGCQVFKALQFDGIGGAPESGAK